MEKTVVRSGFRLEYSMTLGMVAMVGRGFSNPVDMAISSEDRIYVLSRTNPVQTEGIRVGICNLESEYFGDFGSYGSGDGQFIWPTALAFDSEDNIYLADEHIHRITVYDKDGKYLRKWGVHGSADGELNGPCGLVFDTQDNLYVSDHLNHRVQKFTRDGGFLLNWGREGPRDGDLNLPWGLAMDSHGDVYVADWRNNRIQKFSADGGHLATFGESGNGDGQLSRPASVAVDGDGHIYIADWGNERLQVLDSDGAFIQSLRGQATVSKWGELFYEVNPDEKEARDRSNLMPELAPEVDTPFEESARLESYFWGPVSVKLDRESRVYVVESNRHRIQVYAPA